MKYILIFFSEINPLCIFSFIFSSEAMRQQQLWKVLCLFLIIVKVQLEIVKVQKETAQRY